MRISDLETPALLIDLDVMERNLRRIADYAASNGLRLRPHTKTHKNPELAKRQLELGASGLTVAKVGEAEVMLAAGPEDILVAYPIVGSRKLDRLMAVAGKTRVTVALDSLTAAAGLSEAACAAQADVGVLAEVDAGSGRVGVAPGKELIALIRGIERLPRLKFDGVAFYPGHIKSLDSDGFRSLEVLGQLIQFMLAELRHAGIEARIVSGGSTPTLFHSHRLQGLNEIRPGTYIFNDRNTFSAGACVLTDCAASVLVTVVSTARQGQVIIDGGSKTFSSDRLAASGASGAEALLNYERQHGQSRVNGELSFGYVVEEPRAIFWQMNEEHGYVDVRNCEHRLSVGDQVRIIPNHICAAVNLHESMYGIRGDTVEQIWDVEGRGKLH